MQKTVTCKTCGEQFTYEQKESGRLRRYCDYCKTPKHTALEQITCQRCGVIFTVPWRAMWCAECRPIVLREKAKADRARQKIEGITIVVPESKRCSRCQEVKPASEFYASSDRPNGLSGMCKSCHRAWTKQYNEDHKEHLNTIELERLERLRAKRPDKYCPICGANIGKERGTYCSDECEKEKNRRATRVYDAAKKPLIERTCKECSKSFVPEYGNKRRGFCSDKCAQRYGNRVGKATRRARMYDADEIDYFDPLYILARDGWKCYICGCKTPKRLRGIREPNAPEVDHVIPLARGGNHTEQNVRCICRRCNIAKGAKLLSEMDVDASVQLRLL